MSVLCSRQTRLRKEYLFRKSNEDKEKQIYDKKRRIKEAVDGTFPFCCLPFLEDSSCLLLIDDHPSKAGKPIPTELKNDEEELRKEMELEPLPTAPETHMDDEYRKAGINDPKIVVTTSRDPSSRLTQFAKVSALASSLTRASEVNRRDSSECDTRVLMTGLVLCRK